jgi:Rieske Fe-S protein
VSQPEQFPTPSRPATHSTLHEGALDEGTVKVGIDRRTVIRSAGIVGVGAVGAVTLAACGSSSDTASKPAASSASSAAPAGGAIKVADIPVGGGKVFDAEKIVVTQPKAGEFKAFSAVCTHKGCTVKKVADGTIDCPCHGSKFDMTTGAVKAGPAPAPLPPKTATVSGDSITVT